MYNDNVFTMELANKLYDFDLEENKEKKLNRYRQRRLDSEAPFNIYRSKTTQENVQLQPTQNFEPINVEKEQNKHLYLNYQNNQKLIEQNNSVNIKIDQPNDSNIDCLNHQRQKNVSIDNIFSNQNSPINKIQIMKTQSQDQRQNTMNKSPKSFFKKQQNQIKTRKFSQFPLDQNDQNRIQLNMEIHRNQYLSVGNRQSSSDSQNDNFLQNQILVNQVLESPPKLVKDNSFFMKESTLSLSKNNQLQNTGYLGQKQFLENELKPILSRNRSISLRLEFFINKITFGQFFNTKKVQLLKKAIDNVQYDLDLFNILDKQKELEKFKKVFLSEDQQSVFNFFPKPLISLNNEQKVLSKYSFQWQQSEKERNKQKELIRQYLKTIKVNPRYTNIVYKAMVQFKLSIKEDQFSNYQKLYCCYEQLLSSSNSDLNEYPYLSLQHKYIFPILISVLIIFYSMTENQKLKLRIRF